VGNGNNNNAHSAIDSILALNDMKNMNWEALSDSLLTAARGYNPGGSMAGDHISEDGGHRVMGMGSNPLGGMVADMMYQALSGKDYTQYDAARTSFIDPSIGYTVGGKNVNPKGNLPTRVNQPQIIRPAHKGAARPANIQNIIELIHMMNPTGRK